MTILKSGTAEFRLLRVLAAVLASTLSSPTRQLGGSRRSATMRHGRATTLRAYRRRSGGAHMDGPGKMGSSACTGWRSENAEVGTALAGSFRFDSSARDLVGRFGAISTLRGIRYWSVSDRSWETLVESATAVEDPDRRTQRRDFSARK